MWLGQGLLNPMLTISSLGPSGLGNIYWAVGGVLSSGTWPATLRALYFPIRTAREALCSQFWWYNGAAVSGNVDAGIYSLGGRKLASTGSVAQAGTNAVQLADVTNFWLPPGAYYLALVVDNTTATMFRLAPNLVPLRSTGAAQQLLAGLPLPTTFTAAALASAYAPAFGVTGGAVV